MSTTRQVLALTVFSRGVLGGLYPGLSTANHTCNLVAPVLSCSDGAQPDLVDTCCVETFGGLVVQTQFWNTYTGLESKGQLLPQDSWTIHGLWPDFCNGSYTQYCDLKRQYDPFPSPNTTTGTPDGKPVKPWKGEPISKYLEKLKKYDLLEYMKKYWTGQDQESHVLWAHEFSKHATCFSNFDTECYGPGGAGRHVEVADFFATVASYYEGLPTWRWLSEGGVRPSNRTGYSLAHLQTALRAGFAGRLPYVGCAGPRYNETEPGRGSLDDGRTVLAEAWYHHHVRGRVQDVRAVPVDPAGSLSNCATTPGAVWYYERTPGSVA